MVFFGFVMIMVEVSHIVKAPMVIYVDDDNVAGPWDGTPTNPYRYIQDGIDAANDQDTVFVLSGIYDEKVFVNKTINLWGEDRDNTIIENDSGALGVVTMSANWANITGFTIIHSYLGIRILSSVNNVWLFNNNITSINDNPMDMGVIGIYLESSTNIVITDNIMIKNGVYIEGYLHEHWNTHDIETSNKVNGKPLYYYKNQTGIKVPKDAGQAILANCTDFIVEGLELDNCTVGVEIGFSSNIHINNNMISYNSNGIRSASSNENMIEENDITRNWLGIYMSDSSRDTIENNLVYNNTMGMVFSSSDENNITKNRVFNNFDEGLYVLSSSKNNITDNGITNNDIGIKLLLSIENSITNNIVNSNTGYGILLDSSDWNIINYNMISTNSYFGIWSSFSSLNQIFHNIIIDNANQAYDDGIFGNQWDNDYPSGGNFWSDYNGTDLNGTPSQDVPPPDGFGDTPYTNISGGGAHDRYPLMAPCGTLLHPGWNLISVPYIQSDTDLDVVLERIEGSYNAVQWYNSSDNLDHWKHHHILKLTISNDLSHIDNTMGFWINIIEPQWISFRFHGEKPSRNQTIQLHPGWNLVGFPSLSSKNRTAALNNLSFGNEVDSVWTFNTVTREWKVMDEGDSLELGRGYWIHANRKCIWEVPL
jgi:parallel beta-helix repeat protein